jgi:hypothetical protein
MTSPVKNSANNEYLIILEYDAMDLEMLREIVPMLNQQLEKSMLECLFILNLLVIIGCMLNSRTYFILKELIP